MSRCIAAGGTPRLLLASGTTAPSSSTPLLQLSAMTHHQALYDADQGECSQKRPGLPRCFQGTSEALGSGKLQQRGGRQEKESTWSWSQHGEEKHQARISRDHTATHATQSMRNTTAPRFSCATVNDTAQLRRSTRCFTNRM